MSKKASAKTSGLQQRHCPNLRPCPKSGAQTTYTCLGVHSLRPRTEQERFHQQTELEKVTKFMKPET